MNTIDFPPPFPRRGGRTLLDADEPMPRETHIAPLLTQYLSIARRRKWAIASAIVGAVLIGLLITLLMTPRYTSSATLEIQRETRNFTNVEGAESDQASAIDQEFYETQFGLLKAKSLASRVAVQLRLYDDPSFFEKFGSRETDWFANGRPIAAASTREERVSEAGELLLDNIVVSPERLSRLVRVSFTSPEAEFSKRVVDAWTANFVQSTLERRFEATSYARNFLEGRLNQLRQRIDQSERALVDYASRQGIVNLPATTPAGGEGGITGERSIVADDLATLNRELAQATGDRVQAQSRITATGDAVTEALENQAITGLRERRAELGAEYAKLMDQFEPGYPPARALKTQVDQLDRSIVREESRVQRTLRETYRSSLQREQDLKRLVNGLKTGVLDVRRRSIQYNIYQREADTNRQLYDALLQRYKEIGVAGGVGVNNISVVDPAEVPDRPSSPRLLLNLALALLAGGLIGLAAAFALEQIDEAIADPGEVENMLGLPMLGTTPSVYGEEPVAALRDRKSPLSEAYVSLQTNLAFSTDHGVPRSLTVTSTRPAEGKTTTSFALARSIARSNRRVLLVDADMRSPSIHRILEMTNEKGLSNYLAGSEDIAALIRPTSHEGLFTMTAGPQPPSAAELLSSQRLEQLIAELTAQFDHVVFDAPPVMGLADAPLVASQVEGTVFVLESHGTKKTTARTAIGRLRSANAQLIGVVLTKFDAKRAHYGYGYDYGYAYGYGDRASTKAV